MKTKDIKMENTIEKESTINSDFSNTLKTVLNAMSNKILIDKKEYDELIKTKSNFDTEIKSFITKYNSDRDLAYMKYNNQINKLEEQCSQKDIKITQLINEIEQLRKQVKKQNRKWTIF